jgi:hypothetical protein
VQEAIDVHPASPREVVEGHQHRFASVRSVGSVESAVGSVGSVGSVGIRVGLAVRSMAAGRLLSVAAVGYIRCEVSEAGNGSEPLGGRM